jgi:hypothetical protein
MLSPHIHAALPHERYETVLVTQPSERARSEGIRRLTALGRQDTHGREA